MFGAGYNAQRKQVWRSQRCLEQRKEEEEEVLLFDIDIEVHFGGLAWEGVLWAEKRGRKGDHLEADLSIGGWCRKSLQRNQKWNQQRSASARRNSTGEQ